MIKGDIIGQNIGFNGKYIIFDVETANRNQDICQIGAIVIDENKIVDVIDELVKPFDGFESYNVKINGITPFDVENAHTFDFIWKNFFEKYLVEGYIFISHNAQSDLPAINKSLIPYNGYFNKVQYICTFKVAQNLLKDRVQSFKRETLCEFFGLQIQNNHSALSDCYDCLRILDKLVQTYNINLKELRENFYYQQYSREQISYDCLYSDKKFDVKKVNATEQNDEVDFDFVGHKITMSGDFSKFPHREALATELKKRGAERIYASGNLSKNTTLFIAGRNAGPKKLNDAKEWGIRIIDEDTLYKMLKDNNKIN